jgi:hypothetical protein
MDDPDFEHRLAEAFRTPTEPVERPELVAAALARIERFERIRSLAVAGSTLAGTIVAAAVISATGALRPLPALVRRAWSTAGAESVNLCQLALHFLTPINLTAAALALMALASARAALRGL